MTSRKIVRRSLIVLAVVVLPVFYLWQSLSYISAPRQGHSLLIWGFWGLSTALLPFLLEQLAKEPYRRFQPQPNLRLEAAALSALFLVAACFAVGAPANPRASLFCLIPAILTALSLLLKLFKGTNRLWHTKVCVGLLNASLCLFLGSAFTVPQNSAHSILSDLPVCFVVLAVGFGGALLSFLKVRKRQALQLVHPYKISPLLQKQ